MSQVYLITGASTGFGALAARALASTPAKHTIYAGMYSHDGNTTPYEDDIATYNTTHNTDIRPIPLDLLSQPSCDEAVKTILVATNNKLDVLIHNAGHMSYGPAESFTPNQYLHLYDINVVGTQRLNLAVLPHFRKQRSGHLIWIGSSSVYGAKSPMLAGYFAAKAAMDSLAQSYARELNPWGIETTVLSLGIFTKGTNHFADAMKPGLREVDREYEDGPTKGIAEECMKGSAGVVPEDADPGIVAEALVELSEVPRGRKPYRMSADAVGDGGDVGAAVVDRLGEDFYRRIGLERLLKVSIQ